VQQKPIIFLAFANDEAKYLRHLSAEAQRLRQSLSMAKQHGLCDFEERFNISVRDIFQAVKMSEISIFHYAGHADDQTMSLSQPNSENIWIDTSYLNDFLARNKTIKVIFLNACSSKAQAEDLIAKGIPIVIGTSTQISDRIATDLAASFYESLISGHSIGEAWKDATDEILTNTSSEKDIWKKVESISEEEARGMVDKKGMKIRVPWKMYYTDEKNLGWKLGKNEDKMNTKPTFEEVEKMINNDEIRQVFKQLDAWIQDNQYARFKKEFASGKTDLDFAERLKVYLSMKL